MYDVAWWCVGAGVALMFVAIVSVLAYIEEEAYKNEWENNDENFN